MYEYIEQDLNEIILAVANSAHKLIDRWEAFKLWSEYSNSMACGWCEIPNSYLEIYNCISIYLEEDE